MVVEMGWLEVAPVSTKEIGCCGHSMSVQWVVEYMEVRLAKLRRAEGTRPRVCERSIVVCPDHGWMFREHTAPQQELK